MNKSAPDSETTARPAFPFELEQSNLIRFTPGNEVSLEMPGCSFGEINESAALNKRWRRHDYMDGFGLWYEQISEIPFGSEPKISRRFDFSGNRCLVATGIILKNGFPVSEISIDPLIIKGNWQKLTLTTFEHESSEFSHQCFDLSTHQETASPYLVDSDQPFICCLLENDQGERLEIGSGNDLWRWCATGFSPECTASFSIETTPNAVKITRKPLVFPAERDIHRNWRFKWYIAWQGAKSTPVSTDSENREEPALLIPGKPFPQGHGGSFILAKPWPQEGAVSHNAQLLQDRACFKSAFTTRVLRKFIRSRLNRTTAEQLSISGVFPNLCDCAAHLERPGKGQLLHFDLADLMEFHFWANRQLFQTDSAISLNSLRTDEFSSLPSILGLRRPDCEPVLISR